MRLHRSHKICSKCGVDKPLAEYYVRPAGFDGRMGQCKVCFNIKQAPKRKLRYIQKKSNKHLDVT